MPDIGQIKGTNIKRGNSGLDPKTFDVVKEILDATTIIARQEIAKDGRDVTKSAKVVSVSGDGTATILLNGRTYSKVPNYNVSKIASNDIVKVTFPQGQASNMYISGGGSPTSTGGGGGGSQEDIRQLQNDVANLQNTQQQQSEQINNLIDNQLSVGNTDTVNMEINNHIITSNVKDGSITKAKLADNVLNVVLPKFSLNTTTGHLWVDQGVDVEIFVNENNHVIAEVNI